jgi:ABC-type nickel/cobalt efflux system permease component RcnA
MPVSEAVPSLADRNDEFTRLILLEDFTLPTLLLALAISFVWGAAHAMTPGHGKTIVGAYLVGSRGTIKHAVYLGLTTTITHTLGVFAIGLVTLFAAQYILPETLFPWLSLLSGLFVVGIGGNLFASRFKSSGIGARFNRFKPVQPHSPLAFSSMQIEPFTASHNHAFVHVSPHHPSRSHSGGGSHEHDHDHHHHDGHAHQHGKAGHSHMPPEALTWRSLLALGVSGGLIPCPSALVVLLGAIALNKIGFGLLLVLAFSLGLAGALTAIGIAFIYAGRLFKRFPASGRVVNILPVFSALFISLIGLGMVVKAVVEIGI